MTSIRMKSLVVAIAIAAPLSLAGARDASALVLDPTFGTKGITTVPAAKGYYGTSEAEAIERPGGGFLVAGATNPETGWEFEWMVTAFDANGNPDRGFGRRGRVMLPKNLGPRFLRHASADAIAVQSDGKILVGSTVDVATNRDFREYRKEMGDPECNCSAERAAFAVIRLIPDGSLDPTYGHRGVSLIRSVVRDWDESLDAELTGVALDPNGNALIYGSSTDVIGVGGAAGDPYGLIYRLTPSGWIDKSFGVEGRVLETSAKNVASAETRAIGVSGDGAITTVSWAALDLGKNGDRIRWIVRRFGSSGAADTSYGLLGARAIALGHPGGYWLVDAAVAPDSSVTLAGTLAREGTQSVEGSEAQQSVVVRVAANGVMDSSFGLNGVLKVPRPAGAQTTNLYGFGRRADGAVDLAEIYTPKPTRKDPYPDSVPAVRSISNSGQLVADPSGQTVQKLPRLANSNDFFVDQIFASGGTMTLIGERVAKYVGQQGRITLMRVKP